VSVGDFSSMLSNHEVHIVEVRVKQTASARFDTIRNNVRQYIISSFSHIYLPSTLQGWEDVPLLSSSVDHIAAAESPCPCPSLPIEQISLQIHVYQPADSDAFDELATGNSRGEGEEVMAASVCELPSLSWEGLWESLIYSDDIKSKLLDYIYATVVFSDADVDCERYVSSCLLHLIHQFKSMSYRGIAWSCSMDLQEQARHPYVVH
jgi:pachytene checkpoint protein 2